MRDAGLTAGYYYHELPVTGLFASRRYDGISYPIEQFWRDAREGKLANVVFVDPNYTDRAEDMGTSNDYHPGATCWWLRASWQGARCAQERSTMGSHAQVKAFARQRGCSGAKKSASFNLRGAESSNGSSFTTGTGTPAIMVRSHGSGGILGMFSPLTRSQTRTSFACARNGTITIPSPLTSSLPAIVSGAETMRDFCELGSAHT